MTQPTFLLRTIFVILTALLIGAFVLNAPLAPDGHSYLLAAALTLTITACTLFFEKLFRRLSLRHFNLTLFGLLIGYLLGSLFLHLYTTLTQIALFNLTHNAVAFFKLSLFLLGFYLGIILTYRYSKELHLILPFLQPYNREPKAKGLLLDSSALHDPRLVDLLAPGLLNRKIVIPRFYLNKLQIDVKSKEEALQQQAKRTLENIKKIESFTHLSLTYREGDLFESAIPLIKSIQLARLADSDLLISEADNTQTEIEGIKIFNLQTLSKALMPLKQQGESLMIKIQRAGKEELQGVGYLEDGTMVVVNGAGEYLGETVEARVLSVKNTQTGRLIFCNLAGEK